MFGYEDELQDRIQELQSNDALLAALVKRWRELGSRSLDVGDGEYENVQSCTYIECADDLAAVLKSRQNS